MNTELPPRARRIPVMMVAGVDGGGTTSACAENTSVIRATLYTRRNYLRVRGEYPMISEKAFSSPELPPRARRIPHTNTSSTRLIGTTSACAENTGVTPPPDPRDGNYLRVRGEYWGWGVYIRWGVELPPRARRILPVRGQPVATPGTTSACAENTHG